MRRFARFYLSVQVHHDFSAFPRLSFPVVTTGVFDGVHLGHRSIINRLIEQARQHEGQSVVITFDPHPRLVLYPEDNSLELLSTLDERIERLGSHQIDHLIVVRFDKAFSERTSISFIEDILVKSIGTRRLVIGYDHHFGRNREGTFEHLVKYGSRYGFEVEEIPAQDIEHVAVSSTRIRKALKSGDIVTANRYLGYAYAFSGRVKEGHKLGRTIGFPTANLEITGERKLIPRTGVYAVTVQTDKDETVYKGMLNIGYRPTVSDDRQLTVEVHLIGTDENLYGRMLEIRFHGRIRDELKFSGMNELAEQLRIDRETTLELLGSL